MAAVRPPRRLGASPGRRSRRCLGQSSGEGEPRRRVSPRKPPRGRRRRDRGARPTTADAREEVRFASGLRRPERARGPDALISLDRPARERRYDRLAELPIRSSYELETADREFGDFTRPSTVIHLRGEGQEGVGEDVVYTVLDHIAHRDAGPVHDLTGPRTLGEACDLIGGLDLFPGAPPEYEASRHYRRWAYESAALDLALRQSGLAALGGGRARPAPAELRLLDPARRASARTVQRSTPSRSASGSRSTRARVQARPRERLGRGADRGDHRAGAGPSARPEGPLQGHPGRRRDRPELYRAVAEAFPEAYIEDPDLNDETRAGARAARRPGHLGRPLALARRREASWRARRSTRSRRGSARSRS